MMEKQAPQKSLPFLSGSGKDSGRLLFVFVASALLLPPCPLQQQLRLVLKQYLQTLVHLKNHLGSFRKCRLLCLTPESLIQ